MSYPLKSHIDMCGTALVYIYIYIYIEREIERERERDRYVCVGRVNHNAESV